MVTIVMEACISTCLINEALNKVITGSFTNTYRLCTNWNCLAMAK